MKFNVEHGFANLVYRAFLSLLPRHRKKGRQLTLQNLARKYGRGNVNIQIGNIVSEKEYEEQAKEVLNHDFAVF